MPIDSRIANALAEHPVLPSGTLLDSLVQQGMTRDAAKQLISRSTSRGHLWRSNKLKLPAGGRLFALPATVGSSSFGSALAKAMGNQRPGLTRCLAALEECEVLNRISAMKLLSVGDGPNLRRSLKIELDALSELGVKRVCEGTMLESIVLESTRNDYGDLAETGLSELRNAVLVSEIIIDRFRRNALISWHAFERADMSSLAITFNEQVFSAVGYSYLSPVVRLANGKPVGCPVILDSHWCKAQTWHVESFLERLKRATHRGRKQQLHLGVIAALDFSADALSKARRSGLMVINIQQDFGRSATQLVESLQLLIAQVSSETDDLESSIDRVSSMLDELHDNPVVVEIRSIGFEIACGLILRAKGCEGVELGRNVPFGETTRDVDVYGRVGDELWVVEAKAHHAGHSLDPEDVRKFFTETVPSLKKHLRNMGAEIKTCRAEIWTTGPKGQAAQDELDNLAKSKSKKDEWAVVAGPALADAIPSQIRPRIKKLINVLQIKGRGIGRNSKSRNITPGASEESRPDETDSASDGEFPA